MNRQFLAFAATPLLALGSGALYLEYRAGVLEKEVREFCAAVPAGTPLKDFASVALRAGYAVTDDGTDSRGLLASKVLYTWEQERYGCLVTRDAESRVASARFEQHTIAD